MKISITRLIEASKWIATEAGTQLDGLISQLADWTDQGVRALRNGLTFRDNFDCESKTVSLKNNAATTVAVSKSVTGIIITRTMSTTHSLTSFLWYYDSGSKLTLKATFTPVPTDAVDLEAIFLF